MRYSVGQQLDASDLEDIDNVFQSNKITGDHEFKGDNLACGKIVMRTLPGVGTPTCTKTDLPQLIEDAAYFEAKGIKVFVVTRDNIDAMEQWIQSADGDIQVVKPLSDRELKLGELFEGVTKKLGRLGHTHLRTAIALDNGVVKAIAIEDNPGECKVTSGETWRQTVENAFLGNPTQEASAP